MMATVPALVSVLRSLFRMGQELVGPNRLLRVGPEAAAEAALEPRMV